MEYNSVTVTWLGHDGFVVAQGDVTIVIDPFKLEKKHAATHVLITHEHFDHMSIEDLQKVVTNQTVLLCPPECLNKAEKLEVGKVVSMQAGDRSEFGDLIVEAVAAYNIDKFREPGQVFHPKEDGKLGYVITINEMRIYHAGDTDNTPELQQVQCDVALLPVSGTYVMTAKEAAEAANALQPKLAIPMHYGAIVGSEEDAKRFKELAKVDVQILTKET